MQGAWERTRKLVVGCEGEDYTMLKDMHLPSNHMCIECLYVMLA